MNAELLTYQSVLAVSKTICTGQPPKLRVPAKYAPAAVVIKEFAPIAAPIVQECRPITSHGDAGDQALLTVTRSMLWVSNHLQACERAAHRRLALKRTSTHYR
jgi:hypothetical protein